MPSSQMRRQGLRTKIVAWSFFPTIIILFAVALVTFTAYQQVTQDLVIERDREVVRLSASQLATELNEHASLLTALAHMADIAGNDPELQRAALQRARDRLSVFDGGIVILNNFGIVVAAEPERPDALSQDWSNRAYFHQVVRAQQPGTVFFSDIVADGPQGADVIVVAVPITGDQGQFLGTVLGMFRIGATTVSTLYGSIIKLRLGGSGDTYVVDGYGRVIYHSNDEYIGDDFSSQTVVAQALSGQSTASGATRTLDLEGQDIVAAFARVPGMSWGLITEESWDVLISPLRGYQQFLLLLLGLGVVVPVIVVTIGVRRITRPIAALIFAAQEVAAGSFGRKITVTTGDELEELAEQFNAMSAELQASYAHLEQRVTDRTKELAALNAIAAAVSRSLDLNEILEHALEKTLEVIGLNAGAAFRLEEDAHDGASLILMAHRGVPEEVARRLERLPIAASAAGLAAREGYPTVMSVSDYPEGELKATLERAGTQLVIAVPFLAKGRLMGAIMLGSRDSRRLSAEDLGLLAGIGQQVGVAVENARLYQQAEQLAVIKERQRLARELHDSVTQSLYSLTLLAEAGRRLMGSGDTERVKAYLGRLGETAQQALKEMRLLVYELRPMALETEGLVGALQQRLDAVEKRAGVQARLLVEVGAQSVEPLHLPAPLEEGLYRIAQEALNNALKHAAANAVVVRIHAEDDCVQLEVTDNGKGFDVAAVRDQGGLGLVSMRERAERLGGVLTILSAPGEGTTVRVNVGTRRDSEELRRTQSFPEFP